jgi:hypothetical protein
LISRTMPTIKLIAHSSNSRALSNTHASNSCV